ncbi:MAG: helix-turn-helix domain-containing protein [Gammaproteobacteria bacterium]|nr:helix-turn-helix domain-containing protein [Gammaproteobacteria bacterium]
MELDWLVRGAIVGLCALLAVSWLLHNEKIVTKVGALFILGVICYVLVSSPDSGQYPFTLLVGLQCGAIFTAVFFWWFSLVLFEIKLRPKVIFWIPAFVMLTTLPFRSWGSTSLETTGSFLIHQAVVLVLLAHIVFLALRNFAEDLVTPRRHFRLTVATLIPISLLCIVAVELGLFGLTITENLLLIQAFVLLALVGLFVFWALQPNDNILNTNLPRSSAASAKPTHAFNTHSDPSTSYDVDELTQMPKSRGSDHLLPADQLEIEQLENLMQSGAYRTAGLTVRELANTLSIPEHRLRKHINQQLGYRNFSAYLNGFRIEEAKKALSNPAEARKQITSIGYEVGFNSIGPFNRAFREHTGLTPSEYRQQILSDSEKN